MTGSRSTAVVDDQPASQSEHDAYYRENPPAYTGPQVGDFVLVMLDAFRGPDGEFAAADVVTVDKQRPDDVEVEQPARLGNGGRRWVQLSDLALISNGEGPNPL
jgi:hypothetical protein